MKPVSRSQTHIWSLYSRDMGVFVALGSAVWQPWHLYDSSLIPVHSLVALVLMDDSSAAWCHGFHDHFPSASQARAIWIGDLQVRRMYGDLACWLHQMVKGSRCGIILPWGQSLLDRVRSCWCIWLIYFSTDMFSWDADSGKDIVEMLWLL